MKIHVVFSESGYHLSVAMYCRSTSRKLRPPCQGPKERRESQRVNPTRSTTWIALRRQVHLNDQSSTARKRKHESWVSVSGRHNTWVLLSSSNQWVRRWCPSGRSSTSLSRNCVTLLLQLYRCLSYRHHPRVVIFMFWSSFLTFRFLLVRSALRVHLRPPSRVSPGSQALTPQTHETVLSHGHGMKSECLFRGSRVWRAL